MAPGLAAYAQRGRASPVPTADANTPGQSLVEMNAEQFKATVPKTRMGNRGGHSSRHITAKPQGYPTSDIYNEHNDVYDTDLDSATDTAADINPHHPAATDNARQVLHENHLHSDYRRETNEISEENDDSDEEEDEEPEYIEYNKDGILHRVSKKTDPIHYAECLAGVKALARPLALADADSYPDTTSGAISILSETELDRQLLNTDHDAVKLNVPQNQKHVPQSKQNFPVTGFEFRGQNARADHKVPEQARYHVADPPVADDEVLQQPLPGPGSGFLQPLALDRRRTESIRHQMESHIPMTGKNKATHGGPARHEGSKRQYKATSSKIVEPSGATSLTKTKQKDMRRTKDEQQPVQADYAPSSMLNNEYTSVERQDSEVELDHDLDALLKRKFSELQGEDYDVDPRSTSVDSSQRLTEDMLRERMVGLVKAEPERQRQFLASLSLYEWEDAGDWITNEFSLLLNKIKGKRREKRKLSREFEAEVERRHSEVARKRQITDEALVAMRGAGAHVLETPRKMKYQI